MYSKVGHKDDLGMVIRHRAGIVNGTVLTDGVSTDSDEFSQKYLNSRQLAHDR